MSTPKELNFFSSEQFWQKGMGWYENHFNSSAKIRGESSTSYTCYPMRPDVPKRISEHLPGVKLVYVVRDPINRLVSSYIHFVSIGTEKRSFGELVDALCDDDTSRYIVQGRYYFQLEQYLKYFTADEIKLISTETLKANPDTTVSSICDFLGIDRFVPKVAANKKWNSGDERYRKSRFGELVYPRWMQTHPRMPWLVKKPFRALGRIGSQPIKRPIVSDQDFAKLRPLFVEDVRRLVTTFGVSIEAWRDY
jgi:hypothetical protein